MLEFRLFIPKPVKEDPINRENLEKQIANLRMSDIKNYRSYNIIPVSVHNTETMLMLIGLALDSPLIQKNRDELEILHQHLSEVEKNISYCEDNTGNRFYKWLFWSISSDKLSVMRQLVDRYLEQVTTLQNALLLNGNQYYQEVKIRLK